MLEAHVNKLNHFTFPHVHVLDESQYLSELTEWKLGRRFYDSTAHHHTILSRQVASRYRELLLALVQLSTRKLVICDLDNTIWEGDIAEGAITQYHDRQHVLKQLRRQGVLLAINSQNDPKNVNFRGASLDESDFVASEINWEPKTTNIARIRQKLNLQTKDFVFIDDRGDQRELVRAAYPEVQVLDPAASHSWRLLATWSQLISGRDGGDRTLLYRQREARGAFQTNQVEEIDQTALMAGLGLQAAIRRASRADLKRVVELVNRTNQFNLTGARTNLRAVSDWHAARDHLIMAIDASDKFGPMGIICVAFVELSDRAARVSTFVLSCRAFGYGFETAMLRAIQELAASNFPADGPRMLIAQFTPTDLNQPCRSMYPNHGFVWVNDSYVLDGGPPAQPPPWLEITSAVTP
jgi:FkbH-like protein